MDKGLHNTHTRKVNHIHITWACVCVCVYWGWWKKFISNQNHRGRYISVNRERLAGDLITWLKKKFAGSDKYCFGLRWLTEARIIFVDMLFMISDVLIITIRIITHY